MKFVILAITNDLNEEQLVRLDMLLNDFAKDHHEFFDKISVNQHVGGRL